MEFTYDAYRKLIMLLKENEYHFCDYHNYEQQDKCVIMRHDIDYNVESAVKLARIEHEEGIKSTYFVLLRTDFYNPASKHVNDMIQSISRMGHKIGLHFDEVAYQGRPAEDLPKAITNEARILSDICGCQIDSFSMHRPNKLTIEQNLHIPGLVNAYGQDFFHGFKYLSDSRRNWREPVEETILAGEEKKLHILTHAFWYHENDVSLPDAVRSYINLAKENRYWNFSENIRDLDQLISYTEVTSESLSEG